MRFFTFIVVCCILSLASCSTYTNEKKHGSKSGNWYPEFANGFFIKIQGNDSTLVLRNPQDTQTVYAELRISSKKKADLQLPLTRITSLSATHLAFLAKLNKENTLVGFAGLQYVRVPDFKPLMDAGKIKELGLEDKINIEELLILKPDVFMCYPTSSNSFHTIKQSGIPVLPLPDYFESHPLARAEYIILMGILTGKFKMAQLHFNSAKLSYELAKTKIKNHSPTSIAGKPIEGTWYVPAAESYVAQFLKDAGSTYTFSDLKGTNIVSKQVEEVIARASKTDFWFFIHSAPATYSMESLLKEHPSVASLDCYKNKQIFMCNSETVDVFGEGIMEPQLILKDLINAMNRELDSTYSPKYFIRLRDK